MLQKWEKEVQAETILHLSPSMNVDGSSACVAEASSTPSGPRPTHFHSVRNRCRYTI